MLALLASSFLVLIMIIYYDEILEQLDGVALTHIKRHIIQR